MFNLLAALLGSGTILTLAFPMLLDFVGETSLYQVHWFFYGLAYWKMWWYLFLIDPEVVYCVSNVGIMHESLILLWSCMLDNMTGSVSDQSWRCVPHKLRWNHTRVIGILQNFLSSSDWFKTCKNCYYRN